MKHKYLIQFVGRMIVSGIMLRLIYSETGIWTVTFLALTCLGHELLAWIFRDFIKSEVNKRFWNSFHKKIKKE